MYGIKGKLMEFLDGIQAIRAQFGTRPWLSPIISGPLKPVDLHGMASRLQDEQHIYFVMEAALGGNLMELLHTRSEAPVGV